MNWRLVAIPVTLIPIFIIAIQFDIKLAEIGELMHSELSGLIKTNSTPLEIKKDIQLMQIRFKEFKHNFFNDLSVSSVDNTGICYISFLYFCCIFINFFALLWSTQLSVVLLIILTPVYLII